MQIGSVEITILHLTLEKTKQKTKYDAISTLTQLGRILHTRY